MRIVIQMSGIEFATPPLKVRVFVLQISQPVTLLVSAKEKGNQ